MNINENVMKLRNAGYNLKTKAGTLIKKNFSKKEIDVSEVLKDIEQNHNHSWYQELYERNKNNLDDIALIYRGNEITYGEMFENMKAYAKSLRTLGYGPDSKIPVCLTNCPEIIYIIGAGSMIGSSLKIFGPKFPEDYVQKIINDSKSDIVFVEDNAYESIGQGIEKSNANKVVMISLRDSLKNDYNPYEEIDEKTGALENKVNKYKEKSEKIIDQNEFRNIGKNYTGKLEEDVGLDHDFLITFTSGSTNEKRPKAIVHATRTYATVARYHNKDLNGGFSLKPYTFLAHIPTYSNSNLLSIVSDALMQGAKLALEPKYNPKAFAMSLVIHDPHYVAATKSFWISTAKDFLYNSVYKNTKLRNLFLAFSCGETFEANEEKFINKALKKVKAGTNVTHTPFSVVKMSEAGADCEHGSIFYRLFRAYANKKPSNLKNGEHAGMGTFAFVEAAILDEQGRKLGKNQLGRIVANSPCTMKRYDDNEEATKDFFITDYDGKKWADLKVYGYLDSDNKVHMLGRIPKESEIVPPFVVAKEILKDTKNVLSCEVIVDSNTNNYIAHVELQPNCRKSKEYVLYSANKRCSKIINDYGIDLYYRVRSYDEAFPLTGSGKRSVNDLKKEGLSNKCVRPIGTDDNYYLENYIENNDENYVGNNEYADIKRK